MRSKLLGNCAISYTSEVEKRTREKCAKVCDSNINAEYATGKVDHNEMAWAMVCAEAIRKMDDAS